MPTKRNVSQLNTLTDQIIKKNDNAEITAVKDNSLRKDFIASFINWMTGGLLASSEVGYELGFTPTSPNAFARVDMLGDVDLTDYYTKTEIDSFVVVQKEYTNPILVSGGVTCLWVITNELADKYAQVQVYDNSNYIITPSQRRVSETEIIFDFTSYTDIPANTYRCSVQGVQKTPGPPPEGFTYTFPFILS